MTLFFCDVWKGQVSYQLGTVLIPESIKAEKKNYRSKTNSLRKGMNTYGSQGLPGFV